MSYHILTGKHDFLDYGPLDGHWNDWGRTWTSGLVSVVDRTLNHSLKLRDDTLIATYDVPGCDPSSVSVEFEREKLIVSARRGDRVLTHSLVINDDYDVDRASATLKHGELIVVMPKRAPPAKRRVEVKVE